MKSLLLILLAIPLAFLSQHEAGEGRPRVPRIVFYTASWCHVCTRAKKDAQELKGWEIGSRESDFLQIVDYSSQRDTWVTKLPSFVVLGKDGKGFFTQEGYNGREDFNKLLSKSHEAYKKDQ